MECANILKLALRAPNYTMQFHDFHPIEEESGNMRLLDWNSRVKKGAIYLLLRFEKTFEKKSLENLLSRRWHFSLSLPSPEPRGNHPLQSH